MKEKLYRNPNIEVRLSNIKTEQPEYGVFATENIKSGEILEECHWIPFHPESDRNSQFSSYNFRWPKEGRAISSAIVLGYGSIFNHSVDNPNAKYSTDEKNGIYVFESIKDIKKDDEIFTYYGDFWLERRTASWHHDRMITHIDELSASLFDIQHELESYKDYQKKYNDGGDNEN